MAAGGISFPESSSQIGDQRGLENLGSPEPFYESFRRESGYRERRAGIGSGTQYSAGFP